jgi:hypothetical protein
MLTFDYKGTTFAIPKQLITNIVLNGSVITISFKETIKFPKRHESAVLKLDGSEISLIEIIEAYERTN